MGGCSVVAVGSPSKVSSQVQMIGNAELQLIQAALRVDDDRATSLHALLQQPLDWQRVQQLASRHGVVSLIYQRLRQVAPGLASPDALWQMAIWQKANEISVLQMTNDLFAVIRALDAAQIPVLCLKGPVLANMVYGDPAMRCFGDLDMLINPCDFDRVLELLQGMGATLEHPGEVISQEQARHGLLRYHSSLLEIHWRVTTHEYPDILEIAGLFAHAQAVDLRGQTLRTLGLEDLILYACQHGAQHHWATFRTLEDFTAVLSTMPPEQWSALLDTARGQRFARPLLFALALSKDLLGLALPADIAPLIPRDRRFRWASNYVIGNLIRGVNAKSDVFDAPILYLLLTEERRAHAALQLLASIFRPTGTDRQWVSLPKRWHWLYHILRPVRLIGRGVNAFGARLFK